MSCGRRVKNSAEAVPTVTSVIILQRDKSQLDEPVFHALNAKGGISFKVIYLNDYGIERACADNELQLVPNFSDRFPAIYEKEWFHFDGSNVRELIQNLTNAKPKIVLAADLDLKTRAILAGI